MHCGQTVVFYTLHNPLKIFLNNRRLAFAERRLLSRITMNSFAFKVTKLIYDERIRSIVFQAIILGGIFGGFWWLVTNTINNLASQNKSFGFGFLDQTADFKLAQHLVRG